MLFRGAARWVVAGALILVIGWGCDSSTEPEPDYSGIWVGQTAADRDVRMVIGPSGSIDSLSVRVRLSVGIGTCTGPMLLDAPASVSGSSFSATVKFPGSDITSTVEGTFSSETSVSGTYEGYSGSFSLLCGSYYIVGTGSPLSAGSFTATKT